MMNLRQAALALNAQVRFDAGFDCVATDTRKLRGGALFIALRGDNFDGHAFVGQAEALGASAAMVDRAWFDASSAGFEFPLLIVDDTRLALGRLAAHWRSGFDLPVIGITGSNGKTTVKEMCAAILRARCVREGFSAGDVLATSGNLNNDIGLPLTLLELRAHHRAAVIEMGMNHPGEIAALTDIARPTVALVNNAQRAHLAGLGTVQQIAEEKGAIYAGLGANGVAVLNADDAHAPLWRALNRGRKVLAFGSSERVDVRGRIALHGLGSVIDIAVGADRVEAMLHVPGAHNAANALAAAACCIAAGATLADVATGLGSFAGVKGRLQRRPGRAGALILDDSYNANPDSMRAGIDVLASTPGRKFLVMGDMGEVGDGSAQLHDEIGGYAKSKGIDGLFALGEMSPVAVRNFGEGAQHFKTPETLAAALAKQLDADTVVLVKGSRFMRMERVADLLAAVHNGDPSNNGVSDAA